MTDDFMDLMRDSGLITESGNFTNMGQLFQNALFAVVSHADVDPKALAEVLAQFLTIPAPPELTVGEPAGTVRYNLNFNFSAADLTNVSDGDVNRMADRARQFLIRLSEDGNENEE